MCEVLDRAEERGRKIGEEIGERRGEKRGEKRGGMKTRISDVQSLMDTMKLTLEQALDALKITEQKERQSIIKAVHRG